jgi:hypothetical protein
VVPPKFIAEYRPLKLLHPRLHAARETAYEVVAASRNTRQAVVLQRALAARGITRRRRQAD